MSAAALHSDIFGCVRTDLCRALVGVSEGTSRMRAREAPVGRYFL